MKSVAPLQVQLSVSQRIKRFESNGVGLQATAAGFPAATVSLQATPAETPAATISQSAMDILHPRCQDHKPESPARSEHPAVSSSLRVQTRPHGAPGSMAKS